MLEKYTYRARRVLFFARFEVSQLGNPSIETEHLLLGLIREDRALIKHFMSKNASIESIREQIVRRAPVREKVSTSVTLPLSQECKRVFAFAEEEAEQLSDKHIGYKHLLLGLLREEKCFAAEILNERGVLLPEVRDKLRH